MAELRQTHTYALLEVSREAYDEIKGKLQAAGYDHALHDDGLIDMNGIALEVGEDGEQQWLAELAKTCTSCASCWGSPCGGCQGGGVCDNICTCGQRDGIERDEDRHDVDEDDDG